MAIRLQAETGTIKDVNYKIDIHDDTHITASVLFTTGRDGLEVTYRANDTKRLFSPLMPSQLRFIMMVENTDQEDFLTDLTTSEERRFSVAVYRDDGGGYDLWWSGDILPDNITIEDVSFPYEVTINAVDGLANLREVTYSPGGSDPITYIHNVITFNDLVINCLNELKSSSKFYSATENFLHIICSYYASEHNLLISENPFYYTRIKQHVFFKFSKTEDGDFKSCYDILEDVCTVWGMRLYYADGVWNLEQIAARTTANNYVHRYDNANTLLTSTSVNNEVAVDGVDAIQLSGGNWQFYPALKEVSIKMAHDGVGNLLTEAWDKNTAEFTYGEIFNEGSTRLQLKGNLYHLSSYTETGVNVWDYHRMIFRLKLKVGIYYLNRTYVSDYYTSMQYTVPEWTTTESWCYFLTDIKPNVSDEILTAFNLITPPLEASGELVYDFNFYGLLVWPNDEVTSGALTGVFTFENYLRILPDGETANMSTHKLYAIENDDEATKTLSIETNIGDAVYENSNNKLQAWNGSSYVDSTAWQAKLSGTARLFCNQLAYDIITLRKTPRRVYNGTFTALNTDGLSVGARYTYLSKVYMFRSGTYSAKMEELSGEFVEIAEETTGLTIGTVDGVTLDEIAPGGGSGLPVYLSSGTGVNTFDTAAAATKGLKTQILSDTSAALAEATSIIQIPVSTLPIDGSINAGDIVTLVNNVTGEEQEFTVSADLRTGDTYIQVVSEVTTANFPPGSGVLKPVGGSGSASGPRIYEEFLAVSGDTVTVTDADLPTTNIARKLLVFKGGQIQVYATDYTLDTAGANNDVVFTYDCLGQNVIVIMF